MSITTLLTFLFNFSLTFMALAALIVTVCSGIKLSPMRESTTARNAVFITAVFVVSGFVLFSSLFNHNPWVKLSAIPSAYAYGSTLTWLEEVGAFSLVYQVRSALISKVKQLDRGNLLIIILIFLTALLTAAALLVAG